MQLPFGAPLVADCETDGFLENVTQLHCITAKDLSTGRLFAATDLAVYVPKNPAVEVITLTEGVQLLNEACLLVMHNGIKYDLPVLMKLRKDFRYNPDIVRDTLIYARLIWPRDTLRERDFARVKQGRLPAKLAGNHSLEAFGYRLGLMKGDYSDWCKEQGIDPWAICRPEMIDYGVQDVEVTHALWNRIVTENYSADAVAVEHITALHIAQMERNGFPFNEREAASLYAQVVQERDGLEQQLRSTFKPWFVPDTTTEISEDSEGNKRKVRTPAVTTPKRTVKYKNRPWVIEGAPYTKVTQVEFNPASRDHIADRLTKLHGWKPPAYTDNGQPIVDETTLSGLDYPAAKLLSRYLLLQKRAGQISEGNEGWLKVSREGHIFGGVNTIGAVTRRATHMRPNIAQVPKVGSYFGAECRALFWAGRAADGTTFIQCGVDLSGIELRMLAHYMARYDGGAYAEAVVNGSSEQGTDVHSVNCRALGFDPKKVYAINGKSAKGRDIAKTFIYAFLYGAGAAKLASILGLPESEGAKVKRRFLAALPALGKLIEAVQLKAKTQGFLIGLDGGKLLVRSAHSALNTLLQSAGAIVAKYWIAEAFAAFNAQGWKAVKDVYPTGFEDYLLRAWVHDELQFSVRPEIADAFGKCCVAAIEAAGRKLNLRVPITGEFKLGGNWRDCH